MEISGQGISGQVQGTNRYIESSEVSAGKQTAAADGKSQLLNSLEPGSYLYGQVQSSSEDGAVLLLENGQRLLAKLAEGVTLTPGQNVTFQVERKQDGMVYMRPLFAEAALEMTAGKVLKGAGFMNTPKNLEIVKELLELNMPVDKNTIRSMLQKSVTNPEVPIKLLALLEKLGIPATKENIEQLKQYQANEHQIGKQMDSLMKELGEASRQLLAEGKTTEAAELNQKVLEFLYEELSEQGQNTEGTDVKLPNGEAAKGEFSAEALTGDQLSGEETNLTEEQPLGEGRNLTGELPSGEGKSLAGDPVPKEGKGLVGETFSGETAGGERAAIETEGNLSGARGIMEDSKNSEFSGTALEAERLVGNPEEILSEMRDSETVNIKEQMFELKKMLAQTENPAELKRLLSSTKFQDTLEKGMKEAWQIKPSEFTGKDSIDKSYAKVEEQTRLLGELLREGGTENGNSLKTLTNVQQNLEFMQDLNQVFPYIQLPLQMAGESAHGDLYVFKDKKKQHEEGDPFTAFLHLNMEHLGDVDVYLSLKAQSVSTDITLEKEEVLDLFEAHMDELIGRLEGKGYQVSTSLKIGEKKPDFVEDILLRQAGGSTVNRYSFDVKA